MTSDPKAPVPIVIFAAGGSKRLGKAKQLVQFRGRTLLAHAIATASEAACGPVLVVLGAGSDGLRTEVVAAGAQAVENPDWLQGMSSSVRVAIAAVESSFPEAPAVLCTVCDQPMVTSDLLKAMIREHRAGRDLVAASYDGVVGVPALFARRFFPDLIGLTGDAGARWILARHADQVCAIPFEGGALDVDTPADLHRLAAEERER